MKKMVLAFYAQHTSRAGRRCYDYEEYVESNSHDIDVIVIKSKKDVAWLKEQSGKEPKNRFEIRKYQAIREFLEEL